MVATKVRHGSRPVMRYHQGMRALALLFVLVCGCSSVNRWGNNMNPASSAPPGACGRDPLICASGQPQCATDANGCQTCTCTPTSTSGFNSLNPRMDPSPNGPVR
jgi:hypothetical protein